MLIRALAVVSVAMGADYALWSWAISAHNGIAAMIAGLIMAPLAIAIVWLGAIVASQAFAGALRRLLYAMGLARRPAYARRTSRTASVQSRPPHPGAAYPQLYDGETAPAQASDPASDRLAA